MFKISPVIITKSDVIHLPNTIRPYFILIVKIFDPIPNVKIRRKREKQIIYKKILFLGGYNGAYLSTVEVLEPGSQVWKEGPSLPKGMYGGAMVEDTAANSVLYVGGRYEDYPYSADIYRLAGPLTVTSRWEKLPQQLKYPRFWHIAFFVPDSLVHCQKTDPESDSNQIQPL